jgi:hypothetical protein
LGGSAATLGLRANRPGSVTAAPMSFKVPLTGAQQVPAVKTAGMGTADLTWDSEHARGHLTHHLQPYVKRGHHGTFPRGCAKTVWLPAAAQLVHRLNLAVSR